MKKALYSGSFDPITLGHLDIIERASGLVDRLVVGVIQNPSKTPFFTAEERMAIIREEVSHLGNVEVDCFTGLLADYVNTNGFDAVVRGLRSSADFEYEIQMAHMNSRLFTGGAESVFLMTNPEYGFVSSSLIKEVVSLNGDVKGLVPEAVLREINKKYSK